MRSYCESTHAKACTDMSHCFSALRLCHRRFSQRGVQYEEHDARCWCLDARWLAVRAFRLVADRHWRIRAVLYHLHLNPWLCRLDLRPEQLHAYGINYGLGVLP